MNKNLLTLSIVCFDIFFSSAQPGALDLSFDPGTGADSTIWATAVQPDGKILIGGDFTSYNGTLVRRIARLYPDGTLDTTFTYSNGTNKTVCGIQIQPDGKIIVAGRFNSFKGTSTGEMVRINADGTRDTTFKVPQGFTDDVKAIALQSDGKILAGGNFDAHDSIPSDNITRMNADGTHDTTFHSAGALNGSVECIALQPDGKIMIGGSFTTSFGCVHMRIARIDTNGTCDTTFFIVQPAGAGANVDAIELLPDGRLLVGGQFDNYNGSSADYLVRTASNGIMDFNFRQSSGANMPVKTVKVLPSGNYLVGGDFTMYDGKPAPRLALIDSNGILDTTYSTGSGPAATVLDISQQADEKIIISGMFKTYNGTPRHRIARLYNCLTSQPDSIYGLEYALCFGVQQTYSATPVNGATKYEWTLPPGWTGSSDSTTIIAISDGSGGLISVKAFTDSCGYSYATTRTIATIQPANVPICLVTVDTASTHNIIIWEKPVTNLIDSFFIYRETSTNVYTKIAAVPYDSLSEYHDTAANPNMTSYRYKLSVLDTCGAESAQSPYHNTIHLQYLGTGNFQWTFYQIEGQPNSVSSFNFYRDALNDGNFFPIGNIPGTNATFTDLTYSSFPNAVYVVDANWNISCTSTRAVSTTRSNIRRPIIIGIEDQLAAEIKVYPNPADEIIYIRTPGTVKISKLQLFNTVGQFVTSETARVDKLNVSGLPKGIYALAIETSDGRILKKVVVQ